MLILQVYFCETKLFSPIFNFSTGNNINTTFRSIILQVCLLYPDWFISLPVEQNKRFGISFG